MDFTSRIYTKEKMNIRRCKVNIFTLCLPARSHRHIGVNDKLSNSSISGEPRRHITANKPFVLLRMEPYCDSINHPWASPCPVGQLSLRAGVAFKRRNPTATSPYASIHSGSHHPASSRTPLSGSSLSELSSSDCTSVPIASENAHDPLPTRIRGNRIS